MWLLIRNLVILQPKSINLLFLQTNRYHFSFILRWVLKIGFGRFLIFIRGQIDRRRRSVASYTTDETINMD